MRIRILVFGALSLGLAQAAGPEDLGSPQLSSCGRYRLTGVLACDRTPCDLTLNPRTRSELTLKLNHPNPEFLKQHFDGNLIEVEAKLSRRPASSHALEFEVLRLVPKRTSMEKPARLLEEGACD